MIVQREIDKARQLLKMLKEYLDGAETFTGPRRARIDKIVAELQEVLGE